MGRPFQMTTILIIVNVLMSVIAFAAVGAGVVLSRRLRPGPRRRDGRALGRDHAIFAADAG